MALALGGRDELLDAVGEEYTTHLIVVLRRREGQHGSYLGHQILFRALGRAKQTRAADIDHEHHRQLALLLVDLDVGLRRASCNVPVDIAHVITRPIFTHLAERHTTSAKSSVILSGKNLIRQPARLDLYLADPAKNIVLALLHR